MFSTSSQTNTEKAQDVQAVDFLKSFDMSLEAEDPKALYAAIKKGDLEAVKSLIEQPEIDLNAGMEKFKRTALHIAAELYAQSPEIFFVLFNHPKIDVNVQDRFGDTPCHVLVRESKAIPVVEEKAHLIFNDARVNVDIQNNNGASLLASAVDMDSAVIFKLLIDRLRLATPKRFVLWGEQTIPDPETNPQEFASSPFIGNHCHKIKTYYTTSKKNEMFVDSQDEAALPLVIQTNTEKKKDVVKKQAPDLLKSSGRPGNPQDERALYSAIQKGDVETVQCLIEKIEQSGININAEVDTLMKRTVLHIAAKLYGQSPEIFFILFNHPEIDVNAQDRCGRTPCHVLLRESKVTHLVEEKAHLIFSDPRLCVDTLDENKTSLLDHAMDKDSSVIFKLLIDRFRQNSPPQLILLGQNAIPDPETNPQKFASGRWLESCYKIRAYYAALSVLKENKNFTCEQVFKMLKQNNFPANEDWLVEHKKNAFRHAQHTLELSPEYLFALVIFYCDGLLQLKKSKKDAECSNQDAVGLNQHVVDLNQDAADSDIESVLESNARRFFTMARQLPLELQMKLCNVAAGQSKELISGKDSEVAFKALTAKCAP